MGIEKIPMRGVLGAIMGLGIMISILVAIPASRWFLLLSIPAGLAVALVLHFINNPRE